MHLDSWRVRDAAARLGLLALVVAACKTVTDNTVEPRSMSANPAAVTLTKGSNTDVDITFRNIDGQALTTANWLPACTVASGNPGVATAQIVNNRIKIFAEGPGTTTITVTSSPSVKTTITVTVTEPIPVIEVTSFSVMRGLEYELVITGTGIEPGAKVQVNGQVVTSDVLPNGRLRVFYNREATYAMDVATPLQVGVFNPPNGALSNIVTVPVWYAGPTILSMESGAPQGSPDFTLNLTLDPLFGWAAYPVSKVRWNGVDLATTFVDPNNLRAVIPAALLTTAGTYDIRVVNPGPGGGTSSARPFVVTPPAGTARLDFTFYEPQVLWGAQAQDNGPFIQVPIVNRQAEFPVTGSTATFAFVSSVGSQLRYLRAGPSLGNAVTYLVTVMTLSKAEFTAGTIPMGYPFGASALSGTVSGVGAGQNALLQWGNAFTGASQAQPAFAVANGAAGSHGLVGYLRGATIGAGDRVFASLNQAAGSGVVVDFNGAQSAPVVTATASLTGLIAGDQAYGQMGYTTEPTCEGNFLYTVPASGSFLITGFPASLQGPSDRHLFTFLILNGNNTVSYTVNSKALGNFSAVRPAALATPVVTDVAGAPYQIKQAQVNLGGYNSATLFYSTMSVMASRNAFGGATGTLRAPDLSGVAGWNPLWAPASSTLWSVGAMSTVYPLSGCADGSTRAVVSVGGANP